MNYPTKIIANPVYRKVRTLKWQDDLFNIVQRIANSGKEINDFTEDLQLSDLLKTEILMDFEGQYTQYYMLIPENEFIKCKSFNDMIGCVSNVIKKD